MAYIALEEPERKYAKIGHSWDPRNRIKLLQTGNPRILRLVKTVSDNEKELHKRFAHLRLRGEWFEFKDELEEYVGIKDMDNTLTLDVTHKIYSERWYGDKKEINDLLKPVFKKGRPDDIGLKPFNNLIDIGYTVCESKKCADKWVQAYYQRKIPFVLIRHKKTRSVVSWDFCGAEILNLKKGEHCDITLSDTGYMVVSELLDRYIELKLLPAGYCWNPSGADIVVVRKYAEMFAEELYGIFEQPKNLAKRDYLI